MSTIIITKFTASEAYKANPHIADESLKLISALEGVIANYHGVEIENPDVGLSIQVSTSPEAFVKVIQDKELYDRINDTLSYIRIGQPEHHYGIAASDPLKALVGPVHEVSFFTLKSDAPEARAKLEEACIAQNQLTEGKMTYAWSVQDPKTVLVLYSWDSVQAHLDMAAQHEVAGALAALQEIVDMHGGPLVHVELIKTD